ncbi:MAG TPA: TIR domain-containing protein [Longimicrobiaceae bacterium]|jgi:hypothetical protein|nr:TIR domain-containing protein [Longimicrobiaceae bacterium]
MKIFLSWSGERSRGLAAVLKSWLPLVLQYAEPWMSDDIPAGSRWSTEIGAALATAEFGIVCVSKANVNAPWLHFEAGAISSSAGADAVCPLLIDLAFEELSGPLSQFQAKRLDKASMHTVVRSINDRAGERRLDPQRLAHLVDVLWPVFLSEWARIPGHPAETHVETSPALPSSGAESRTYPVTRRKRACVPLSDLLGTVELSVRAKPLGSVAGEIGVGGETLRKLLTGADMHARTVLRLEEWYWRSGGYRPTPHVT